MNAIQCGQTLKLYGRWRFVIGRIRRMPALDLTDDELAAAAMAARGAAALARKDAERQTTLSTRAAFEDSERRYRNLAEKFERARVPLSLFPPGYLAKG